MSTLTPDLVLPSLAGLVRPQGPQWSPDRLRDLVTRVAGAHGTDLLDRVRFASPQRWWARLALTEEVEVWLLSWLPGQHTEPHDHGGASGAFAVVLGELAETYRYPGEPIGHRDHTAGSAIGFGAGRAHQVWNTGLDEGGHRARVLAAAGADPRVREPVATSPTRSRPCPRGGRWRS